MNSLFPVLPISFVIILTMAGCTQEPSHFPPSLTVENKSRGVIWYSYVKINDRVIPFGGVGASFFATVGFSLDDVGGVRSAVFGLRISTSGEAGSSPWIERIYETVDPVLPDKSVLEKVRDVRFVYSEDRSAKALLLGESRSSLGEIQMKLREELSSDAIRK